MQQVIRIIFIIFLFFSHICQAIFVNAVLYRNKNSGHLLIRLDDIHIDISDGEITYFQHEEVLKFAQEVNALVIAEDVMASPSCFSGTSQPDEFYFLSDHYWKISDERVEEENTQIFLVERNQLLDYHNIDWQQAYSNTPLYSMFSDCYIRKIKNYNIDFRLAWGISCAKESYATITLTQAMHINDKIIEQIESWVDDPPNLKEFYKQSICDYRNNGVIKKLIKMLPLKPEETVYSLRDNDSKRCRDEMRIANARLIDPFLLHTYFMFKDTPVLISCAGAAHHEQIESLLPSLGYEKVMQTGNGYQLHYLPNDIDQYIVSEADLYPVFNYAKKCASQYILMQNLKDYIHGAGILATYACIHVNAWKKAVQVGAASFFLGHLVGNIPTKMKLPMNKKAAKEEEI